MTDGSDGVLPGVTVVAVTAAGQIAGTTATDGTGAYRMEGLPPGVLRLTFQLEGFTEASIPVEVRSGAETVAVERMGLASIAETVNVYARAPAAQPLPPLPVAPPPPPPPVLAPVPVHDHESICGPAKPQLAAESFGTIRSLRHDPRRALYSQGDEVTIDGGTATGLTVGRNLVVRRYYDVDRRSSRVTQGEHTAGLLQIVAADDRAATAVVIYACDELMQGDFLASFEPEPVRPPEPAGVPAYNDAARILFADAGQMVGVPRRMMVIDRGSRLGIRVGQRLTLFRRDGRASAPVLGEAVVVAVRADSATIRIEQSVDVIDFGDYAAPQRAVPAAVRVAGPVARTR